MLTLQSILLATASLSSSEKESLLLFLVSKLREERGAAPSVRVYAQAEMNQWIAEDESDMRDFLEQL